MPRTDGTIIIGTSVDVGGINTGLNNINKSMKKLGNFATLAAGVSIFVNLGKAALDAGSDLQEVQNVVDVAFGDMAYKMEELAKTSIETLGMSEYTAKNMGSIFMNMGRGIGFASEEASDMAIELTKRASDMASFLNISQDYARVALSAVYTGETETLKRYGIVITEANLQQYALTQGINESVKAMDSVTKARLRYQYVMQQTAHYEGDFARTSGSWANQTRILTEQFRQLLTILGTGLISVLTPVIQVINKLMSKLIQFANTLGTILSSLFGIKKQSFATTFNDSAKAADNLGKSANNAAGGVGSVGDSAKDSAKKVRKALASFDDLNQLMQKTADSSADTGGGGGGGGGDIDAGDVNVETGDAGESLLEELKSNIDSLYELGQYVGNTISDALYSINWPAVYESARNFGTGLAQFLNGLISTDLFSAVAFTIASSLNTAIYEALAFGQEFDWSQFGTKLGESINTFFQTFDWEAFGEMLRVWALGLWTAMYKALTTITWSDVFKAIGDFFSGLGVDGFMAIAGFIILKNLIKIATSTAFLEGLQAGLGLEPVETVIKGFGNNLGTLVKTTIPLAFRNFINSHAILMEVELFLGQLKTIFDAGLKLLLTGGSSTAAQSALAFLNPVVVKLTAIGTAFAGVSTAFTAFLSMWNNGWSLAKTAIEAVGLVLTAIGAVLLGAPATVAAAIAGITFAISQVVIFIHDNWDGIKQFFADLWESVKETFASAWEGIKSTVSSIGSGVVSFFTETIPNAISVVIQWFSDLPSKIGYALGTVLGTIASWVVNVANKFATEIPKIITAVVNFFKELPGKIKDAIDAFKDKVVEWAGNVKTWFTEQLPAVIQSVVTFFTELPGKIKGAIDAFKDKIVEWAGNVKTWFSEELPSVLTSISDWFKDLPQKIYDAIAALKEKIKSIGKFILDGIIEGLNAAKQGIKNFASSFVQGFKDAFKIHSPSKLFEDEIGSYLGEGIIKGLIGAINDATKQISIAMLKVMDIIEKRWDSLISKINADPINNNVDDNMAGVSESFRNSYMQSAAAWAPATQSFKVIADQIVEAFKISAKTINEIFSGLWISIKSGFVSTMNTIIIALQYTVNSCVSAMNSLVSSANSILSEASMITGKRVNYLPYISGVALPTIPALANGAVIPANSQFLALLGDQKHGTNIEAPLDTIVAAFQKVAGDQNINITFKGSMAELVRVLKPEIEKEDKRKGVSLLK